MQKPSDEISKYLFKMTTCEAQSYKICIKCKTKILNLNDKLSSDEYNLSSLCRQCQISIFDYLKPDDYVDNDLYDKNSYVQCICDMRGKSVKSYHFPKEDHDCVTIIMSFVMLTRLV